MVIPIIIPMNMYGGGGGGSCPPPSAHNKWRGGVCDWCYEPDKKLHGRLDCYAFAHGPMWFAVKHTSLFFSLVLGIAFTLVPGLSPFFPDGTYQECHIPGPDEPTSAFDCKNIWEEEFLPHANNTSVENPDGSRTWYVSFAD